MRRCLLCLVFLIAGYTEVCAQQGDLPVVAIAEDGDFPTESEQGHELIDPAELEATRAYQQERPVVRRFAQEKWRAVVEGVNYDEAVRKEEPEQPKESVSWEAWNGSWWRVIAYIAVTGMVITILYFLLKNISFDFRIRKTKITSAPNEGELENIEALDTRAILVRAIEDGDFKLAVRLYFLALLKTLNEKGVIVWKKDKTNKDYLTELFLRDFLFDEIRDLTRSYESVWYGDHDLRQESFRVISRRFEVALEKVNAMKTND